MNVQEHEMFLWIRFRKSEKRWSVMWRRDAPCGGNTAGTWRRWNDVQEDFPRSVYTCWPSGCSPHLTDSKHSRLTHTHHFTLQICDITSGQRLSDGVVELPVLTEDVLHGAEHSEGEQRFRKFSEERLQDHSGNVDVSVLIEVHRFTCTRSNETNLYWHAHINTNTLRRFKKVISHVLLSSLLH